MAESPPTDPNYWLKKAFAALLKGDLAERDRCCNTAQHIMNQQGHFSTADVKEAEKLMK